MKYKETDQEVKELEEKLEKFDVVENKDIPTWVKWFVCILVILWLILGILKWQ